MDFKKKYIVRCISTLLNLDEEPEELVDNEKLQQFLTTNTKPALLILYKPGKKLKPVFPDQDFPLNANLLMVVILKMQPQIKPTTLSDGYSISLSTSDCLNSIVEQINQTYIPLLDQKEDNLKQLLKNFSSSISSQGTIHKFDQIEVQSVTEEFLYWKKQQDNAIGPDMKKKAQYFQKCYAQIQTMWNSLEKLDVKQLKQLADITFASLDDVWSDTYPYNSRRFANLIKIMTKTLWLRLSTFIPTINSQAKKHIKNVQDVIKNWFKYFQQYTAGNWRMKSFPFTETIQNYYDKIDDVKEVLSLFDEITRIKKKISIQIDFEELREIFSETVPLSLDPVLVKKWNKAKNIFISNIESKGPQILSYLKENSFSISKVKSKPMRVLAQMRNWNGLLGLNFIKENLFDEKKQIFKFIQNYLDSLKHEYESRTGQSVDPIPGKEDISKVKNFSPFLSNIVWTRQVYDKVNRIVNTYCVELFKDIDDLESMKYQSEIFLKDIQSFENQQINKWKSEITEASYSDEGLQLQKDAKMMTLDMKNSILYVNYSDRLILLIREVRQLNELGLRSKIPQEILENAEMGKKYYKQALVLKKIAAFYNNMSQQIIDCQKGMLLDELKNFQSSVKSVNDQCQQKDEITWDKPSNVDRYIEVLNRATNRLVQQNSRLYKLHMSIMDIIASLAMEDLRKSRSVWLSKLNQIKELIETGCQNKDQKYCRRWKIHCDVQLYKVLEMQFLHGLDADEAVMNDMNIQVMIKNRTITFKPSFEDLKQKYYKEVMDYIMWPSRQFKGILGNLDIYQRLGEKNNFVIKSLITKAESTFSLLTLQMKNLQQWSVIPYLSARDLGKKIKTMQQWQFNIRVIRMKRKQLQKLADNQKVQCFNINMVKFKNQADQYLSEFVQSMMVSLKESVIEDTNEIQKYLNDSLSQLATKPSSVEQMQLMKNTYMSIKGRQKDIKRKFDEILIKKKWILQSTGYHHQTAQLQEDWHEFDIKIQDYDTLLAQQIEYLKSMVGTRVKQLQNQVIKFESKTTTLNLPSNRNQLSTFIQFIKEQKNQQQEIHKKIEILQKDCEQFQLSKPIIQIKIIDWSHWQALESYWNQITLFGNVKFVKMKNEKMFEFQDFCLKWQQQVKPMEKNKQVIFIIKEIDTFKSLFNLFKMLSSGILQKQHWRQFFLLLKTPYKAPEDIVFADIMNISKQMSQLLNQIQQLLSKAQGQATLKQALQELAIWWQTAEFELTSYEGKRNKTMLIKEWKEISLKVSDNMSLVSSLKESRWIGKYLDQVENFEKKIGKVERSIYSLNNIQRKWIYLEPILVGGALPQQMERFDKLDGSFRSILNLVAQNPKIYTLANIQGLEDNLTTILQQEQKCQKALNDYLQLKRSKFPRFYFLGDEDLLQILAQTKNPSVIQLHMKKLFAAIHSVQFAQQNKKIVSILSIEKQRVQLTQSVILVDNVEIWLDKLQKSMFTTLEQSLEKYITLGTKQIKLADYCSQILCLMQQIRFSNELHQAVSSKTIKQLSVKLKQDLQNLTKILPTVSKLQAIKLKALILDLIHHLNVVQYMTKDEKPVTLNSYSYTRNFRFNSKPQMQIFNNTFKYTFEYQGNLPKLVHTPLTDKCYITLALALSLGMGGNPYGPAGTGKTQTVKSMAMLFGRMCLVFNCDEALDYKSMGRIFFGLVKCGAWGCFDEFNRLLQQQLSAISQQIQVIQFAIKAKQPEIQLIGKTVQVNHNSGIFVTLNPAGKGYGGRSKLPDNLKQLFRPVAMAVPDNQLIAEVYLYAEGFKQAKQLAQKIICLFTLSKQLLSPQQHYDWGLRALKTILSVAGRLISTQRSISENQIGFEKQCQLLIKAIRVNVLSKLTFTDMRKFKFLLQDIFPGIQSKDIIYEQVEKAVKQSLIELGLQVNDNQIAKILQFYQATQQRMGVVLVGPSGCGKTTIWKVLKKAYEKMQIALRTYLINPKSMPRQQLLGYMDNDTRQFTQGVLTSTAREVVKSNSYNNWIILDGDIDPQWIESLNSVLDDNHILTLPTGERISFATTTCFIFQTDSLIYASPATVSRMGMIYLNNQDINIQGIVNKWTQFNPQSKKHLQKFTLRNFLGFNQPVTSTIVGQVNQVLSQMKQVKTQNEFITAIANGLTANYSHDDKPQLITKIFQAFGQRNPFSPKQSLFFYSQNKSYRLYSTLPQQFDLNEVLSQNGAILKTIMAQSYLDRLKKWVNNNQNFLLVGPEGCGKSMLIKHAYSQIKKSHKINFATMYCNSQTNAQHVIQKLYQICMKINSGSGKLLKPKQCYRQVLYLKDINLPKPDKYQTIQLVSFLQQVISHKGFYDPQTLQFVSIDQKIQIVASMLPSNSIGRNPLTTRFTAIVRILNVDYPTNEELVAIYTEYFTAILKEKDMDCTLGLLFAQFLIDTYNQILNTFSVDTHRHYNFTPKHLFKMFKSLIKYEFSDKESLAQAIANQYFAQFRNKLVSFQAKNKFEQIILSSIKTHFKITLKGRQFFCVMSGKYQKIPKQDYITIVKSSIVHFQRTYKPITFVYHDECLNQISSIEKALNEQVSISLFGKSGAGRQTCLQIAAIIAKIDIVRLPNLRNCGPREFKKQLKLIIENALNDHKKVILLLEDHNFSHPSFIEMTNSLMTSGEIPGLFALEELERLSIIDELRQESVGKSLYDTFCQKIKQQIKIVLSLDISADGFHEKCASNPAIFASNIIWFDELNKSTINSISTEILTKQLPQFTQHQIDEISNTASSVFKKMEADFNSPQRDLFEFLMTFASVYKKKSQSKQQKSLHLQKGLGKLSEAKQMVDVLSKEALKKQEELAVKQQEANKALKEIEKAMSEAAIRRRQTEELSGELQKEEQKIHSKKQSVEQELAGVKPILDEAKKSVSGISSANLNELASLPKPPEAVKIVMKSVVRIFGEPDAEWNTIKGFLKNRSFIDNIMNFDPRVMGSKLREEVQREVEKNGAYFEKSTIYRASLAAGPLADWTKAILKYSKVVEAIKPLETQLSKVMKAIQSSKRRVLECEQELAKIDSKVKELKKIFSSKTSQAQALKNELTKAEDTLKRAQNLLSKLQDENIRWTEEFKSIEKQVTQYPILSFIASAFIIYLSDKDEGQRDSIQKEWLSVCNVQKFEFLKFMIDEGTQLKWRAIGLASDQLSVENSVMVLETNKIPLMMDPNNSGISWLKQWVEKLQVTNQSNPKFTNELQLAVRFGKNLMIQELDEIEPILVPILKRDIEQDGSRSMVHIGDKVIEFNKDFKLYLSTRNTSMKLPSNTLAFVSLINYSVTQSGLESKLLSLIINQQKPQLQSKKTQLLHKQEELKMSLVKLQGELLEELGNSSGNILENKALLDNLTKVKVEAASIEKSLAQSDELNIQLDSERDTYRPLAKKGAILYLILTQLWKINNMYRFSLKYFTKLFLSCLKTDFKLSIQKNSVNSRLEMAFNEVNRIVFSNVSSALFKKDRLAFGLYLVKGVFPQQIPTQQWQFFTGLIPPPLQNKVILPSWASFDRQEMFNSFCSNFPKLAKQINFNDREFEEWNKSQEPQKKLPSVCDRLTSFQKILIIMVFKPQKLQNALNSYVTEKLSISSVGGSTQTFSTIVSKQIDNSTPALFIVSQGFDPSKQLEEFCEAQVGRQNYLQLSMGGGQNNYAIELVRKAASQGKWLCLKNLHLVTAWLSNLQKELKLLEYKHQNFRIFLTSEQHLNFPNILLQTCFKVSYESPPGLKKNFLRTYQQIQGAGSSLKNKLVFLLAYFHALVQERKNYIPQGWSKSYKFSYSDLKVSLQIIDEIVQEYEKTKNLNLELLYGTFEDGIYGGRIDNFSDQKVLRAYLRKYFNLLIINSQQHISFQCMIPKTQKQLTTFVNRIPQTDNPKLFGLPSSIDKAVQKKNCTQTIQSLKQIMRYSGSESQIQKQQWEKLFTPLIQSWKQVYKQVKSSKFPQIKSSHLLSQNPIQSFIYLQGSQALSLFEQINQQFSQLELVIQGKSLVTNKIQQLMKKFASQMIPTDWLEFWDESTDPYEWIRVFGKKLICLKDWVYKAQNSRLLGQVYDLAQLFHPVVFLNACKQYASRNKVPLDKLSLVATFEQERASENAIKLKNLLIQGCSLANYLLTEPTATSGEFEDLPLLYVDFLANPPPLYPNQEDFCLYSSVSRQNLLLKMKLGISGDKNENIIAGTALFLREI